MDKIDFLNLVVSQLPLHFSVEVSHFIAAQFAYESSFGSAPSAKSNHNYCGMLVPSLRLTTCLNPDDKGSFAEYCCLGHCVNDYLIYLVYNKFNRQEYNDLSLFVNHLGLTAYSSDNLYIAKIFEIYNQYYSLN